MEIDAIKARIERLAGKIDRGQRLSAVETGELKSLTEMIMQREQRAIDALKGEHEPVAFAVEQRQALSGQIKDAVNRGIIPGISSEPGGLVPSVPGYDVFEGRTCSAPGKPGRFGKPGKCGRQASAVMRSWHPEAPSEETIGTQDARFRRELQIMAYGLDGGRMPYAASGPRMGKLVEDRNGPPRDGDLFVCLWHSRAANISTPHPEDVPPEPKPVVAPPAVGALSDLDASRQWRVVGSDPNFCDITDGITAVLVRTSEYLAYLRDRGSLPRTGQRL